MFFFLLVKSMKWMIYLYLKIQNNLIQFIFKDMLCFVQKTLINIIGFVFLKQIRVGYVFS